MKKKINWKKISRENAKKIVSIIDRLYVIEKSELKDDLLTEISLLKYSALPVMKYDLLRVANNLEMGYCE